MSGGEIILYAYGAVCICMLLFNIVYDVIRRGRDSRIEERSRAYESLIREQLREIREGREPDRKEGEDFLRRLERRLSRVGELTAFEQALEYALEEKDDPAEQEFIRRLSPVILRLAEVYKKKDNMQAAYFAWLLSRHGLLRYVPLEMLEEIMIEYMSRDSLYCRVNALQALYEFGTAESVVRALDTLDRSGGFISDKILTDGLMSYRGDHAELIRLLWERFPVFSAGFRLPIMNYIRYRSGDYAPEMYAIMNDEGQDKELRISAMRYFGRYHYEPAKKVLLDFAADRDPADWEYAAVSVTCLAAYPGPDVTETLIQAVHSSNWYVRYNAAASLDAMGLEYGRLMEILDGRDRYAREMMMYRLDSRRLDEMRRGGE